MATTADNLTHHRCPKCNTSNFTQHLKESGYQCPHCGFKLVYLDIAPNGMIRGILGWVRTRGDVIQERYRIKTVLGKGGFGVTYLVEDLRLDGKRWALKEIPEPLFDEYEVKLLAQLNHPAIPDVADRFTDGGMVYLILKFGGSKTLGSERARLGGKIPMSMLIPWIRQVCDALIYLHSRQPPIIHRDLKPDNILLDEHHKVMLIDFGIAKVASPSELTRTLGRAVTHGFSPPEQMMGSGTDERSDIYALGATVYFLLTGSRPPPVRERIAGTPLMPLTEILPEIPAELNEVILRSLHINPNQRQQTIQEFAQLFKQLDTGESADDPSPTRSPTLSAAIDTTELLTLKDVPIERPSIPTGTTHELPHELPSVRNRVDVDEATTEYIATGEREERQAAQRKPATRSNKSMTWWVLALLLPLAGGLGYYVYQRQHLKPQIIASPTATKPGEQATTDNKTPPVENIEATQQELVRDILQEALMELKATTFAIIKVKQKQKVLENGKKLLKISSSYKATVAQLEDTLAKARQEIVQHFDVYITKLESLQKYDNLQMAIRTLKQENEQEDNLIALLDKHLTMAHTPPIHQHDEAWMRDIEKLSLTIAEQ